MVTGGNKEHGKIDKQYASPPTTALQSVLLTAVIHAYVGYAVTVIDIPNTFV